MIRRVGVIACLLLLAVGCVQDVDLKARPNGPVVLPTVPPRIGEFTFEADPNGAKAFDFYYDVALTAKGELYAVRGSQKVVQATLQTSALKPQLRSRLRDARRGVLGSIGGGQLKLTLIGTERVYALRRPEQRIYVWFAPDGMTYEIFVATLGFAMAEDLLVALLAAQRGEDPAAAAAATAVAGRRDVRRGSP